MFLRRIGRVRRIVFGIFIEGGFFKEGEVIFLLFFFNDF